MKKALLIVLCALLLAMVFSCGDDKDNEPEPETTAAAGNWIWSCSDDSETNEWKIAEGKKQTVFAPGGVSRITNVVEEPLNPPVELHGKTITTAKRPYKYPAGSVTDNDGNPIEGTVYNFTGNTKVGEGQSVSKGARYPMVGWEAVPADEETLALLRTAYSYSFWVRNNESTKNEWSYLTAVVTNDIEPEEGYDYKHYYGKSPGSSGGNPDVNNATNYDPPTSKKSGDRLKMATWYKITVVLKKDSPSFNLAQDSYIWQYNPELKRDFNVDKAEKIQWQISLQNNDGDQDHTLYNGDDTYFWAKGNYDFNVDFYGFELNME